MKNIKKFESFDGFAADEEADQMKIDQAFAERDAQDERDAQNGSVDILARFEEEFGDNTPSNQELMEFYHKLRTEGVDGIEIFDTLLSNNKIGEGDDENYSDDEDEYDPENDEDFGATRADGSDGLGAEDENDSKYDSGKYRTQDYDLTEDDYRLYDEDDDEDYEDTSSPWGPIHKEGQFLKRFNNFK